jgi:DNA-binding transcriptional LysR family regulator
MNRYGEMEAFVQVVEAGGFTEAARKLRLSPSAVSKLISRLEDRLGARLLHRTTRRVSLTAEGRAYFDELRGILAEIDAVEASIGGAEAEPRGLLRVNVAHGFGMSQIVPLVPDFIARYPQVQMQISFDDHIVDLVSAGEDVGIRLGLPGDDTLIARKLGDYRRMICGAVSYFERFGVPQTPADLEHHRAVLSTNVALLNHWPMRFPDGRVERVAMRGIAASNSGDALYRLLLDGMGLGFTADFLCHKDIAAGRIRTVLDDYLVDSSWPIYAVYPARKHLAAKVRAFVDFLVERFTPQPPWMTAPPATDQPAARRRVATSSGVLSKAQTKR